MNEKLTMSDTEVTLKGIEALQKSLGYAATWRFLSLVHGDATDYVKISQQLYQNQTVDEIYNRASQNWKE
jgi:hypothetical protein